MKYLKLFLILSALVVFSALLASNVHAQENDVAIASGLNDAASQQRLRQSFEPLEKEMFFPSKEACVAAFASWEFRYYMPDPKNLRTPPSAAKGLPGPGCAHEVVRESKAGSPSWVILAANVPAVFGLDGIPVQDGRCWNAIDEFVWLELPRGRDGINGKDGLNGRNGAPGRNGRDGAPGHDASVQPPSPKNGHWYTSKKVLIPAAIIGAGLVYGFTRHGNSGPIETTTAPCTHLPCTG